MTALAIREPSSLVEVDSQCAAIEVWAEQCESVPELRDAGNRLAAIDEYLNRTSTEGRSRVAAAMRRLEARIGSLLGPRPANQHVPSVATECIDKHQRSEFRAMAEHPEVVEEVKKLAGSRGGVNGLLNNAAMWREKTGQTVAHCVAAAAVDLINQGRGGKKLPSWWKS